MTGISFYSFRSQRLNRICQCCFDGLESNRDCGYRKRNGNRNDKDASPDTDLVGETVQPRMHKEVGYRRGDYKSHHNQQYKFL